MAVYGLNKQRWFQVISAYSGWLMDGYTTIAYALVAVTVSTVFFPSTIGIYGLIATFGGLAVEEIARPVGSVALGNFLGDRIGRKNMLTITIVGFSVFAASKGLLPSYKSIGILAPVLLYIILFIEGTFAGAEYGGGTTLSMEDIPAAKRAPIGAFVQSGYGTGFFIVSFVFAALSSYYGKTEFAIIGWRVLFYTTIIPGMLTLIIRYITSETTVFDDMKKNKEVLREPVVGLFKKGGKPLIFALIFTSGLLFINTVTFSFYPALLSILNPAMSNTKVGTYNALINLVSLFGVWIGGITALLIVGRKKSILVYSLIFIILTYPIAFLAFRGGAINDLIAFSVQAFFEAMIFSTLPAFLAESFGKQFRTTGVGFAYNGGAVFGGFAISIVLFFSTFMHSLFAAWTLWLFLAELIMVSGMLLSAETFRHGAPDRIAD
ncbi:MULTISPECIES: MFS transporter [Acidiplasma]|uniref:MFS transporter n=3 Tax=Acidiplasma TaxID=507753 RepID=A0A0Q1B5T5_9ARCH|nr:MULTISPECIES: MFS transporter [Acidiplasma]KJE48719.1 MFS transporter [Acidiplasma sp. MBA-1]KPV46651.1 MFS transporter [Acidiplasma aeolicum]KQB35414.1 MFS transporter [Acidiplasma cupricumulans]WMT55327.1 MAG: MFS transporter [Acidiplasma sp.]